ncbi:hypothetical protein [Sphingomonas sp. R1]|nr:hypothetical protein [Sphingomonas sp. R1]UYY77482.1 hypothetical protein OIM94_00265 [Sphingomonas sp. R1]
MMQRNIAILAIAAVLAFQKHDGRWTWNIVQFVINVLAMHIVAGLGGAA